MFITSPFSFIYKLSTSPFFFDGEGIDPGTATPAPATVGAPAAVATATPPATAPTPATSVAPGQDRSDWVPPYRLRETREAAQREAQQQWAQREAQIRAEADQYRTQLHALVGVQPPQNPEIAAVRAQFAQLYPGLAKLEERGQDIQGLLERAGDLESQTSHYWQSYGRQTMDRLFTHATESLGTPLTEEGKRQLHSSFTGYVSSSPELTARYANDPSIVEDFWKQFTSSFIDPVRRVASASVVGRAPTGLPQDTPGGAPQLGGGPKPQTLDERAAVAWAQYNQPKA